MEEVFTKENIIQGFKLWNERVKNNPDNYKGEDDGTLAYAETQTDELIDCIKESLITNN